MWSAKIPSYLETPLHAGLSLPGACHSPLPTCKGPEQGAEEQEPLQCSRLGSHFAFAQAHFSFYAGGE